MNHNQNATTSIVDGQGCYDLTVEPGSVRFVKARDRLILSYNDDPEQGDKPYYCYGWARGEGLNIFGTIHAANDG